MAYMDNASRDEFWSMLARYENDIL